MAALTVPLDMTRPFLPEALGGLSVVRSLDAQDRRRLNQIRACSYLHLFDSLEAALGEAARKRARGDVDARDTLAPLLRFDAFDHHELFRSFEAELIGALPVEPRLIPRSEELSSTLDHV